MKCPYCNHIDSKVTDSRVFLDINSIKRRRECIKCNKRFTTFETVDISLQIKKRNGTYADFDKSKLIKGLDAACCHTTISHDEVRSLVNRISADLLEKQIREIDAQELGQIVMNYLKKMDVVAYIRFSCVYKRFKRIDQLIEAIDSIKDKKS
jgi:transcriptional repressor NrdR